MNWRALLSKPLPVLSGLAACCGLLVDFQGAATKLGNLLPIIDALLPLIALVGSICFGVWLISTICLWGWEKLPATRFSLLEQRMVSALTYIASYQSRYDTDPVGRNVYRANHQPLKVVLYELKLLKRELHTFSVPCPEVKLETLDNWVDFLTNAISLSKHRDLKAAKVFWLSHATSSR